MKVLAKGAGVLLLLCTLVLLPGCVAPSEMSAAVSLKLWPTRMELVIPEGGTDTRVVKLENAGDESLNVLVHAMDFTVEQDGTFQFQELGHETYSCARWVSIDQSDFHLGVGETKAVNITVDVPEYVEPGGHYAAVFFEQYTACSEGTSVSVGARIVCLLYVTIPGVTDKDVTALARIEQIMLPGLIEGGPVKIGTLVRNEGNVHLMVAAKAYFANLRGGQVNQLDLGQAIILPGGERLYEGTYGDLPLFGKVRATVIIGYYDDQGALVNREASADFQVIPWKVIIAVSVPLCMLGLAAFVAARKFRFRLKMERRN